MRARKEKEEKQNPEGVSGVTAHGPKSEVLGGLAS